MRVMLLIFENDCEILFLRRFIILYILNLRQIEYGSAKVYCHSDKNTMRYLNLL